MQFAAPVVSRVMRVEPQWIDYNGHLNMAYYNVLFDRGIDDTYAPLGLDETYLRTRNGSFFTLEAHVLYLRELRENDPVQVSLQILDHDTKRIHAFQELRHAGEGFLSATSEIMSMHVDMTTRRAAPFPEDVLARIAAMHAAHRAMPRPPQAGRVIGIPR